MQPHILEYDDGLGVAMRIHLRFAVYVPGGA